LIDYFLTPILHIYHESNNLIHLCPSYVIEIEAERRSEEQRQAQLKRMREQEARWRQIAPPVLGEIVVPGSGSGFVVDPVCVFPSNNQLFIHSQ
jgi:hypothetical protein